MSQNYPSAIPVASILIVLDLFGIIFNALTLAVIATSKKMRGPFNILLMNLCVSDIIAGLISLVGAVAIISGETFMFLLIWFISFFLMPLTGMLVCVSANYRFAGCQWPSRKVSEFHMKWICGIIWSAVILGATVMVACSFMLSSFDHDPLWSEIIWLTFYKTISVLLVSLMIVMTVSTVGLIISIYCSRKRIQQHLSEEVRIKRKARDKSIVIQLVLIIFSFYLGYIPQCVLAGRSAHFITPPFQLIFLAHLFLRISECLNPIFYQISSSKLRAESKAFVLGM